MPAETASRKSARRESQRSVTALATERSLERRNIWLQNTLENLEQGISVFDRHGRLIAWNSRFLELLELPTEVQEGTVLADILRLQTKRGDFGAVDVAATVKNRCKAFYEDVPTVRERETVAGRILQLHRSPLPDGGIMTLYTDITEQREAEHRMAEARAEAEQANRSKSSFLAHMSHELRTPLNAIIGFSELICEGVLGPVADPKFVEYLGDIHASGMLLLSIVNDVLDMSKIEAGKLELSFEQLIVQDLIAQAVTLVSELAQKQRIKIDADLPKSDIFVSADERALKQILLNLLSNAIKFSYDGSQIDIRASQNQDDGIVTIEIEDYGIGMTSQELKRALQPFGQASADTTRIHGGTGLGLPIVNGLVDAHGGRLTVHSQPGRGTCVQIFLPLHPRASVRTTRMLAGSSVE